MLVTLRSCIALLVGLMVAVPLSAQDFCQPAYRIVHKTVYQQEQVTAYRLVYETAYQQQQVTSYKPVWSTQMQERRYTVAKPVVETSTHEERYTVLRPEWTTEYQERCRDEVHYTTETATRQERIIVNKPVTETVMQNYNYTTYEPVTTMRTQYVDQGGYVDQQVLHPGVVRNQLRWLPGYQAPDPVTGAMRFYRGGLHWIPNQQPGVVTTRRAYVPNVVAQNVPQTNYVAKVVTAQKPVQVTRWQRTEEVRDVPYTVQKPVVERVTFKVPVRTCRMIRQEMVRKVPVTTRRIQYEERVEQHPVQVCKMVAETKTVQTPHTVAKWVPYTTTRLKPRIVTMRIPIDPYTGLELPPVTRAPVMEAPVMEAPGLEAKKVPTEAKKKVENKEVPPALPEDSNPTGKPKLKLDKAT